MKLSVTLCVGIKIWSLLLVKIKILKFIHHHHLIKSINFNKFIKTTFYQLLSFQIIKTKVIINKLNKLIK
jgi:hypothetical protein